MGPERRARPLPVVSQCPRGVLRGQASFQCASTDGIARDRLCALSTFASAYVCPLRERNRA